jgi:hypothetical protein
MKKIYKCPKCGEKENLHFNYDYSMQHRPIKDVLCNECGEVFEGNMPVDVFINKATSEYPELEGTMKLCEDIIQKRTGKMNEEEWQAAEKAQTSSQTDKQGKPLTYWGGLDFTNPNANNIKSGSTIETNVEKVTEADYIKFLEKTISTLKGASSQTEILNEEIEKAGQQFSWDFRGSTEYELSAFIEGAKWYREQLKNKL